LILKGDEGQVKNKFLNNKGVIMPKKIDTAPIYQIKITLLGINPPIWRRVLVSGGLSLGRLHGVLQATMGWYGGHLHQFEVSNNDDVTSYGPTSGFFLMEEWKNETRTKVGQCLQQPQDQMLYTYDLGDSWEHLLELEEILPANPKHKAVCIAGERAAPPENCGGIGGYEELLEAVKDAKHPDHESMIEWLGEMGRWPFDPERFHLAEINRRLA
jgi:hypothetical protein